MGIQLRGSNGGGTNNNFRNRNNGAFSAGELEETPQMRELRMKREAEANAAKEALAKKQEEQRLRALAFEQRDAAKRQREQMQKEEEEIRNNPKLAAERAKRLAEAQAEEEQRARFRAEEEAKIEAERRVQEKKMDQTEALIAAIRAQVEKEKAAKEEANKKEAIKSNSNKSSAGGNAKPQFRTISPEEMAKLEEKKRMKAAGIQPEPEKPKAAGAAGGLSGGVSDGLGGLGNGPTLSNPSGNGPTLSNMNAGQQSLNAQSSAGGGLGIDITVSGGKNNLSGAEENTVALNVDEINAAVEKSKEPVSPVKEMNQTHTAPKPHVPEPVQVVGGASTIIVDGGDDSWGTQENVDEISWVDSGSAPQHIHNKTQTKDSFVDENGDVISVVPVRQRPVESNDVQSVYNIDFDDDDDDVMTFGTSVNSEEEARRQAEEEARRKAEEEARRQAEEEARRKAEEEARRKAEEEARRRAEEEARRKAEEEARRKAEEEARRQAEEEARRRAEEEVRRKAEEEARRRAEEEARRKAEEEARRKAEEEARRKAEEEARRQAEEEARRRAEEEARRKAEEEARRQAEEEARRKAEEEARRRAEEEARRKAEEEARRKAEEEALKYKKMAEEAERQAEEARKALEAAKQTSTVENVSSAATGGAFTLPVGVEQYLGKYLTIHAISDQIINTMKYVSENPSEPRNIVVLGQYGFGTTTIAEDFARSFYAMGICRNKTIAKIKAGALNRANISDAIGKLQGGCLVIENAGVISHEKLEEIYRIVSDPANDVIIIMTGQIDMLSKIFKDNVKISTQFKHLVQVHRITDMDVFEIAKNHAGRLGYPCEEGSENNLRRRMQEVESGNLDRVLKIVDNAVSKAHNREMTTGEQEHRLVSSDFE